MHSLISDKCIHIIDQSNITLSTCDGHLNRISSNWMLTKAKLHWMQKLGRPNNLRAQELQKLRRKQATKSARAHNLDENQKLLGIQKLRSA